MSAVQAWQQRRWSSCRQASASMVASQLAGSSRSGIGRSSSGMARTLSSWLLLQLAARLPQKQGLQQC